MRGDSVCADSVCGDSVRGDSHGPSSSERACHSWSSSQAHEDDMQGPGRKSQFLAVTSLSHAGGRLLRLRARSPGVRSLAL